MELKLKKIEDKVELDTQVQGCWSDCHTGKYSWTGLNKALRDRGARDCIKKETMSPKTNFFL